jgi:SNF2 family DNA or RNA helicase
VVERFFGGTEANSRPDIMRRFQDPNDPLRFLVANPATGKYSWTLTTAHTAIYYSNSYKLEDRYQSEDRLHRIGQENKVTYIDLVAPGTVDEVILQALRDKRNIAAEIMGPQWREALAA